MTRLLPVVILLLAVPVLAIALVFAARRSRTMPRLALVLALAGAAGAVLAAFYTFTASTVPIAPYETGTGAWIPILWQVLASAYVGFGLGVVAGLIGALPILVTRILRGRKSLRPDEPRAGEGDSPTRD